MNMKSKDLQQRNEKPTFASHTFPHHFTIRERENPFVPDRVSFYLMFKPKKCAKKSTLPVTV